MKQSESTLIISGVHLDLTEALKSIVREKADKLFRHEQRIIRIRVELEFNTNRQHQDEYVACGHIEMHGPPMVVREASDDLYKSVDLMVNKLDRMLRRRARLERVKRKSARPVEIPADLPKVEAARA